MADDIGEAEEITSLCGGLNINIGTLNRNTIPSMFAAGKKAKFPGASRRTRSGGSGRIGPAYADGAAAAG